MHWQASGRRPCNRGGAGPHGCAHRPASSRCRRRRPRPGPSIISCGGSRMNSLPSSEAPARPRRPLNDGGLGPAGGAGGQSARAPARGTDGPGTRKLLQRISIDVGRCAEVRGGYLPSSFHLAVHLEPERLHRLELPRDREVARPVAGRNISPPALPSRLDRSCRAQVAGRPARASAPIARRSVVAAFQSLAGGSASCRFSTTSTRTCLTRRGCARARPGVTPSSCRSISVLIDMTMPQPAVHRQAAVGPGTRPEGPD